MSLVRTVIREISQAEGNVTALDIVNSVLDKMRASGSTPEACDNIRERLIGIAVCALTVLTNLELVTEWAESSRNTPSQEQPRRVLH